MRALSNLPDVISELQITVRFTNLKSIERHHTSKYTLYCVVVANTHSNRSTASTHGSPRRSHQKQPAVETTTDNIPTQFNSLSPAELSWVTSLHFPDTQNKVQQNRDILCANSARFIGVGSVAPANSPSKMVVLSEKVTTNGTHKSTESVQSQLNEKESPSNHVQMKRKLPEKDEPDVIVGSKIKSEVEPDALTNGCSGPAEKKQCTDDGGLLTVDQKAEVNGAKVEQAIKAETNPEAKEVIAQDDEKQKRELDAAKIRAMLMLEETNLLLLKKLKASQTPKPVPVNQPTTAAPQSNSAVATNSVTATAPTSSVPGVTQNVHSNVAASAAPSVQNVNASFNNLQNHSHQSLHTAVHQQQQLLQQIQQNSQIKAVVAQQQMGVSANQRRPTVIPSAPGPQVPSVNTNPPQQQPRVQATPGKVNAQSLPPNVVPNALFRGPPPSVTPGTTVNNTAQNRNVTQAQNQQQPTVRADPAAAAKREQAAKLALKKQLEKTLLQIPPPRPPPANLDFLVWPTIEFLYLIGLEETVENVLVNTLMKPSGKEGERKRKEPLQCAQCQSDFTTAWKRDADTGKVICEQCLVNNNKKAVKKEHTNRLKLAVEQALQQEKEVIQKLKDEERKQALANQQAAANRSQQQQTNVGAAVASLATVNSNANSIYHGAASTHAPVITAKTVPAFVNPTLNTTHIVSSTRPTVHATHQAPKGRILNPAPASGRGSHHGMRKY